MPQEQNRKEKSLNLGLKNPAPIGRGPAPVTTHDARSLRSPDATKHLQLICIIEARRTALDYSSTTVSLLRSQRRHSTDDFVDPVVRGSDADGGYPTGVQ